MKPKFKNKLAWEQAEVLMQPALIRVLDNIRKQLDKSTWKGDFKEVVEPIPGYHLCLSKNDMAIEVDVWQLCYQVCFKSYISLPHNIIGEEAENICEVDIDPRLFDETGDIDWQQIEAKAQQSVRQVFKNLPQLYPS